MKSRFNFVLSVALLLGSVLLSGRGEVVCAAKKSISFKSSAMDVAKDMKVGWNLGNSLDAYDSNGGNETVWGNPLVTRKLIQAVKAAGFKTIRIPVTYMGRIGKAPDYKIDEKWLNRVQEVVNYAMEEDLYVIINIHSDGNHDTNNGAWLDIEKENQKEIQIKYQKVWKQISNKFKNYDEKLLFESMNEVMERNNYDAPKKTATYTNINALNQICVNTVRATGGNNTKRFIIVPGYNTNIASTAGSQGFQLPQDTAKDKLMVSVHYYDPYDFALNESNDNIYAWGQMAINAGNTHAITYHNESSVESSMSLMKGSFASKGVPFIVGEFGAVNKSFVNSSNDEYRRYFYEYVTKTVSAAGGVVICWDNGWMGNYGFALFNRKTNTPFQKSLIEAIIKGASGSNYEIKQPQF